MTFFKIPIRFELKKKTLWSLHLYYIPIKLIINIIQYQMNSLSESRE